MHLIFLKITYLILVLILTASLILRECGITKKLSPMGASDFVSSIAGFFFGYVICAFLLALFLSGWSEKFIMLMFAASPFIIGKLATYQKIKIYSIIQIACIIISGGYIILV